MIRVRVYRTMRIVEIRLLEYCEYNRENIKSIRFKGKHAPYVVLKNNDFVLFMSRRTYRTWCLGRTYYDDLHHCYRRSDLKISK